MHLYQATDDIQTASRLKQITLFQERNVRIRIRILPVVQSADPHVRILPVALTMRKCERSTPDGDV